MSKQEFYQEDFIEQYLKGTLPTPQMEAFETALAQDSKLQEALTWQKDIIEGIQEARRAELKARLKALPTPRLSLWQQPATWIKATGLLVSLVLLLTLLMRSSLPIGSFFESELPLYTEAEQEKSPNAADQTAQTSENKAPKPKKKIENTTAQESNSTPKENTEQSEVSDIAMQEAAPLPAENGQIVPEDKSNFQFEVYYQYYDNVLQLFENIPYQLIKADLGEGEKAYLYTKESFFELRQSSSEIFNLKDTRISNPSHIEKLQALKK